MQEEKSIIPSTNTKRVLVQAIDRLHPGAGSLTGYILLITLAIAMIVIPTAAQTIPNGSALSENISPDIVQIGVYVVDFNRFNIEDGTVEANFYSTLVSDTPISIDDLEIMNGHIKSVDTFIDTPNKKEYRIIAALTADPDLRRYPFDRHTLPLVIEPKLKNEQQMILMINPAENGFDPDADLPGWQLTGTSFAITNKTYVNEEVTYSRAVFDYGITRDATSTVLKFFLPIMLIIVVALSSLMMKVSSWLGLNASMFLAAVMIH
ncbi:MAG: hypothetical protein WC620_06515 [Methanoregula sp.]